jgi:transposase InsO family protein/predicted aspartyl protease
MQTRRNSSTFINPPSSSLSSSATSGSGIEKVGAMELVVVEKKTEVNKVGVKVVEAVGSEPPLVHDSHSLIVVGGRVEGRKCEDVLVDGGASSNFVLRAWAEQEGLRIRPLTVPIEVTLANRGSVFVKDAVRVQSMNCVGSEAPCVLLVLDSLSHNVVLGVPWLHAAKVTIDFGRERWNGLPVHTVEQVDVSQPTTSSTLQQLQLCGMVIAPDYAGRMEAILLRVGSVFSTDLPKGGVAKTGRAVKCGVVLTDPRCRPAVDGERRRSQKDIDTLTEWTRDMLKVNLIRASTSSWRAQAVLVAKHRDGVQLDEKRPCLDYRRVNNLIQTDSFPLPLVEDLMDKLTGMKLFSKLDLTKGFWQIPMDEQSRHVLAFSTPLGLFEPRVMPFGMKNAPAVFQREMQRVLSERLMKGVIVFVDDILIYTKTADEHADMVEWVLTRLRDEGYIAHPDKCEFFQREVSFLGHVVNAEGIAVQQHKVQAVRDWPTPKDKKEVRGFLGLTGYYRRFIKEYGQLAMPLTDLLHETVKFKWGEKEQQALDALKERLTQAPVMAHPDHDRQFILHTDASGFAVSGVLSQKQDDGKVRPVAYLSKKMDKAEINYSTFDQELLAIVTCLDKWKVYITGTRHPVLVYTDHYALQWIRSSKELTGRQARWLERIGDADFVVHHIAGTLNGAADALSRRADHQPVEYRLTESQAQWLEQSGIAGVKVQRVPKAHQSSPTLSRPVEEKDGGEDTGTVTRERKDTKVKVQVRLLGMLARLNPSPKVQLSLAQSRVIIPLLDEMRAAAAKDEWYESKVKEERPTDGLVREDGLLREPHTGMVWVPAQDELRSRLVREAHEHGGHHGVTKTLKRLNQSCWWEGMRAQVTDYVRGCEACARAKSSAQLPAGLLQPLPIPGRPWEVITLDFVGPLKETKNGNSMVLVVVDKFSKEGHFIATQKTVNAEKTARLLLQHVVKHHSLPTAIVSDRDPRFTSDMWKELWHGMGTELRMSSSYHPQTDGQTERLNRTLETGLRLYCNSTRTDWDECLHLVEAFYNSSVHESTGKTPFEMNGTVWTDAATLALQSPVMTHVHNQKAEDVLSQLRLVWAEARRAMMRAQEKQKKYADEKRRDERYEVGDLVMLSLKHLGKRKGKLSDRWVGPFPVKELIGDHGLDVRLELPKKYSRMAQTIHVDKLKHFTPSQHEWPGRVQGNQRLPAVLEEENGEYEVERVIGKRITFEDVEEPVDAERKVPHSSNPFSPLVGQDHEDEETKDGADDSETWRENKYDDNGQDDEKVESSLQEEEVKEREEPVRRVTRATTRAARERQVVSVHALRLTRSRGGQVTPGTKEKREVVWYLVQWKGYGEEYNSWVRAEDMHAPDAIREYEEAQRRGDDLGVHYLHCKAMGDDEQLSVLSTRVVGDWSS